MEYSHRPVLLGECLDGLNIKPNGIYVDGTLGRAGHSLEIAQRHTAGRLIAIDRDQAALDAAPARLKGHMDKVTLVRGNFGGLQSILASLGIAGVDGMLFDLGVSSPQLDDGSRGFSYLQDAPLDMRMDQSAPLTAWEVVNGWSQEELRRILWQYGEERYVRGAMPAKARREKQHPAKRSFQAIRIAVNDELGEVERMLAAALDTLNPGGRLAVISFHSLEDRLVKSAYADWAKGCTCPPDFPVCVCGKTPKAKLIGKRPITAGEEELRENPRARSAKLRIAEKR